MFCDTGTRMVGARGKWSRLVTEWKRSGLTARAFAARRGIRAGTLAWWHWRLGRDRAAAAEDEVQLDFVPVEVDSGNDDACVWQLTTAEGHVLRVCRTIEAGALRAVLAAITAQRRSR